METAALMAISPLDGRYQEKIQSLRHIFSEFGLIKFRLQVEINWIKMLAEFANLPEIPALSTRSKTMLDDLIENFSIQDALRIKHIEAGINHDVKALEYFIKEKIAGNQELAAIS